MGLLTKGTPLEWPDARRYANYVRTHGIKQFLSTYRHHGNSEKRCDLLWGDEVF